MKKQFEIGIDHPMLKGAKAALDTCLKNAVSKAISTGMDEGSATLKISFTITQVMDDNTEEAYRRPEMKYKAGCSVPMKASMDGTVFEKSRLQLVDGGWLLVSDQVSMDELMEEAEEQ